MALISAHRADALGNLRRLPGPDGVRVLETYGITVAELQERLDVDLPP
ncbi:hypothetical protein [Streptomyces aureus]|uniref:Uncharacterized protein n=1 Tax=Streptomyces aureus TaxID=193461 RepID=A0ABV4SPX6_9ACTN